ncbi:hypothetical protein AB0E27_04755, partial [Streptomyces sparsogenes]|uniref:hypothetical protein n=1 Tax=Streptomyces sparsogenes TaxID=67365 RepID=UPI0033ED8365
MLASNGANAQAIALRCHAYAKEEKMATTAESPAREKVTEGQEEAGYEGGMNPLLLAALMRGREERGESLIQHPLLLAALMRRREERGESLIQHPLL